MTRTRLRLLLAGLCALALLWSLLGGGGGSEAGDRAAAVREPRGDRSLDKLRDAVRRIRERGQLPWRPPPRLDGQVTIAGAVIDAASGAAVPGVEVVFRNERGEETTTAGPDGKYAIDLPIGTYRAFVRDDTVLSIGVAPLARIPQPPSADAPGAPDEQLMLQLAATEDLEGVDLAVTRGGVIRGKVVDRSGRAIADAVVRARSRGPLPALGTDTAATGADGTFELRLPGGRYVVEASHVRFAGVTQTRGDGDHDDVEDESVHDSGDFRPGLRLEAGAVVHTTVTLTAGCIIAGRVIGLDGRPAGEGAIERQWGAGDTEFGPDGRIAADGTFRWTTVQEGDHVLRAWPWKAPPSLPRRFTCRDGARFDDVVFTLQDRAPDLDGVLVDAAGAPVAAAYLDIVPLDGGIRQQERTDEHGRWSVYQLPAGQYRLLAYARDRGVVMTDVASPQTGVRLQLRGTGRLEGTITSMQQGTFALHLLACRIAETPVQISPENRLVTVANGRFAIEGLPAQCDLQLTAHWRGHTREFTARVPAGGSGRVTIHLGPPPPKRVSGRVTGPDGRPITGAFVHVTFPDAMPSTRTDGTGWYTLDAVGGARIRAEHYEGERPLAAFTDLSELPGDETVDLQLQPEQGLE